jgi:hypothetical protein
MRLLASTAGLNQDLFDALVVLAAGAWTPMRSPHTRNFM